MGSGNQSTPQPVLVVHGGAWDIPEEMRGDSVEGCQAAARAGWAVLTQGGSALDAVETAVRALEDDPTFDAGHGSVLNARGHIEMDAIIMDGRDLNLGAVMAVRTVRHPITLARLVMAESEHAILAGEGAEAFARERGIAFCPSWELVVDREAERWRAHRSQARRSEDLFEQRLAASHPCGTVGAVTIDGHGHLAAATSTGGKFSKHPGRVGDSPLVGCGAYADDRSGAVSATGDGEQLMKILISKSACDFLLSGMTAQAAADACISLLAKRTGGRGGVIVLGKQGDIGIAHNTSHLVYAHVTGEAGITSRVSSISDA